MSHGLRESIVSYNNICFHVVNEGLGMFKSVGFFSNISTNNAPKSTFASFVLLEPPISKNVNQYFASHIAKRTTL